MDWISGQVVRTTNNTPGHAQANGGVQHRFVTLTFYCLGKEFVEYLLLRLTLCGGKVRQPFLLLFGKLDVVQIHAVSSITTDGSRTNPVT